MANSLANNFWIVPRLFQYSTTKTFTSLKTKDKAEATDGGAPQAVSRCRFEKLPEALCRLGLERKFEMKTFFSKSTGRLQKSMHFAINPTANVQFAQAMLY